MRASKTSLIAALGLLTFSSFSFANPPASPPADRILCLSSDSSFKRVITLRTDVTQQYISPFISLQTNGQEIYQNLVKITPIQSNGIDAWAWAYGTLTGQTVPTLSLLKLDLAARSGTLIKSWPTVGSSAPYLSNTEAYYLAPDQTVRRLTAAVADDLQTAQDAEQVVIKTATKALTLGTMHLQDGSVLLLGENADHSFWVHSLKTQKLIDVLTLKMGTLKLLATVGNESYWIKESKGSGFGIVQWEVFSKNYFSNSTQSLASGSANRTPEFWIANKELWSLEETVVNKEKVVTVKNITAGTSSTTFPDSFIKNGNSTLSPGYKLLLQATLASNGTEVVFSLGSVGGVATLNLTNLEWEFHGTNGSSYACFNPQLSPEVPWSF